MKTGVYSIYDRVAKIYGNPVYFVNHEVAIRGFTQAVRDPQSEMGRLKDDLELVHVGYFDDATGSIEAVKPELVVSGNQIAVV